MPPGGSADSSQYSYSSSVPSAALPAANRRTVCKTSVTSFYSILPLLTCMVYFRYLLARLLSAAHLYSLPLLLSYVAYFRYLLT